MVKLIPGDFSVLFDTLLTHPAQCIFALTAALSLLGFSGGLKKAISLQTTALRSQEGFTDLTTFEKMTKYLILKTNTKHFATKKTVPIK